MDGVAVASRLVLCGCSKWVVVVGCLGSVIRGAVAGICAKTQHCSSHEFGAPFLVRGGNFDVAMVVMLLGMFALHAS